MNFLNVGCGNDIRKGWINLDNHDSVGANVVFDLDRIFKGEPLPFRDNTFDRIICYHVLHTFLHPLPIIKELIRVCKPEGVIDIKTHMPNANNASINMVRGQTQGMLRTIANSNAFDDYNKDSRKAMRHKIKLLDIKYYTNSTNLSVKLADRFVELV